MITVMPDELVIGRGRIANFNATATGISSNDSNFLYEWKKRDSNSLPLKVLGANTEVLIIPSVHESDEGQYYCIVINEWNSTARSDDVSLSIFGMSSI